MFYTTVSLEVRYDQMTVHYGIFAIYFILKNGPIPASFSFVLGLFKQTMQFLQQIIVKMSCPSNIWCWDLNP